MTSSAQFLRRLGVAAAAPLVFLAAAEIAVEALADVPDAAPPIVLWGEIDDPDLYVRDAVFRSHREWFWEPRPGARFCGETINLDGYRGPRVAKAKGSAYRVVTLGDSSTMGYGVNASETWSAVLERLARAEGRDVEVVNLGVVGFTAFQGVQYYKGKALDYAPDLVVLAFGACNEQYRDADGRTDRDKARILASSAYGLRELSDRLVLVRWLRGLTTAPVAPLRIPPDKLRPRVSPEELRALYTEVCQRQAARGARVAIVSPPRTVQAEKELPETLLYTRAARDAAAELGVPLADVHGAFRADESARKSELYLDAVHPASKGHELYGTVVKRALDGEGVLPARLR